MGDSQGQGDAEPEEAEEETHHDAIPSRKRKRGEHAVRKRQRTAPGEELGLSYKRLYTLAREAFLTNSDQNFKSQLTEFRDHHIVQSVHAPDGTEMLYIPFDANVIDDVLDEMEL